MSTHQYQQYQNLHIFAQQKRGYKLMEPILNEEKFRNTMQIQKYIKMVYKNEQTDKPVLIYLLAVGSKYFNESPQLKRLLTAIQEPSDVILVSEGPFKIHHTRAINKFTHLRIKTYLHENFALDITKGPLCFPHTILSKKEVSDLLNNELYTCLANLPNIFIEDVQCIWAGAEVGDVVRIDMFSPINGPFVQYRAVVPKKGRIISFRERDVEEEPTEEVDDVSEFRDETIDESEEDE